MPARTQKPFTIIVPLIIPRTTFSYVCVSRKNTYIEVVCYISITAIVSKMLYVATLLSARMFYLVFTLLTALS